MGVCYYPAVQLSLFPMDQLPSSLWPRDRNRDSTAAARIQSVLPERLISIGTALITLTKILCGAISVAVAQNVSQTQLVGNLRAVPLSILPAYYVIPSSLFT